MARARRKRGVGGLEGGRAGKRVGGGKGRWVGEWASEVVGRGVDDDGGGGEERQTRRECGEFAISAAHTCNRALAKVYFCLMGKKVMGTRVCGVLGGGD